MGSVHQAAVALTTLALVACGGDAGDVECQTGDPAAARPLTANDQWLALSEEEDPFWEGAADPLPCGPDAIRVEDIDGDLWFDVTTEGCNYLTVAQPSQACAMVGEDLTVWLFHYAITEGEGSFNMALAVGEPPEVLWETERAVPAVTGLVFEHVSLERPIPPGTPVTWHISNHGVNTWSLIGVFVGAPGAVVPGSRSP